MADKVFYILMADIIKSRSHDQAELSDAFKQLTVAVNGKYKDKMVSPITVTLGDEFQCVLESSLHAVELIFLIEETIFSLSSDIKLRYVLAKGAISSAINTEIGWGMMGEGLAHTRERLNSLKKSRKRFCIDQTVHNHELLNDAFLIYEAIIDGWNIGRDYPVIAAYTVTENRDYKDVARLMNKNPDQIWKKEKNLKIMEYYSVKRIIDYFAMEETDARISSVRDTDHHH